MGDAGGVIFHATSGCVENSHSATFQLRDGQNDGRAVAGIG